MRSLRIQSIVKNVFRGSAIVLLLTVMSSLGLAQVTSGSISGRRGDSAAHLSRVRGSP